MKTELIELSQTRREIKIEIEPEEVRAVYNSVSRKFSVSAQVPGFRKGMAPVDVIRMRYKNEIRQDTIQELLTPKVKEAIIEYGLTPLAEPELHLENANDLKLNGSQSVSLHVHVEVMPEITDLDYKGFEAVRRIRPVDESEVERIIGEQRQRSAIMIPIEDRASEEGDTVIVDLEGVFVDEPDAEPIKADDLEVKLGDSAIEKSFTQNLAGLKQDDIKEFTMSYEADFTSPALAGKTVSYTARVKTVGRVELPEFDDEWAKSLDQGFESAEALRQRLRLDLEQIAVSEADNKVRNDLIASLVEKHPFEVPNSFIEMQARSLLNNFGQDLARRGVDLDKVEKDFIQMAYGQMRTQAERDVRGAMLLERVADLENADVTDDEIAAEIESMASYYHTTAKEMRASLAEQRGGEENVANSLRTRKAVAALVEHAKISDGEWIDEAASAPEVDADDAGAAGKTEKKAAKKPKKQSAKKSAKEA